MEYIAEDRKQASLDAYFATVPPDQLARIEAIAMDMWEPYVQSVLAHVPDGKTKIVFDKYHIMSHMGPRSTPSGNVSIACCATRGTTC